MVPGGVCGLGGVVLGGCDPGGVVVVPGGGFPGGVWSQGGGIVYHVTYPIMHLMLPVCCLHTN